MGRLPEAWVAPPAVRELRELVRYRAQAGRAAVIVQGADPLGAGQVRDPDPGQRPVRGGRPGPAGQGRAGWCLRGPGRLAAAVRSTSSTPRSTGSPRWSPTSSPSTPATPRSRRCPGSGRCSRRCSWPRSATSPGSPTPDQLCSWAGLTPRHYESDTTVHRGHITKQGSPLVRWAAVEAIQRSHHHRRSRPTGPGSRPAAAATSPRSPRPTSCSPWSSTGCATGTSGPSHAASQGRVSGPDLGLRAVVRTSDPRPAARSSD